VRRRPRLADRLRALVGSDGQVIVTGSLDELPAAIERLAACRIELLAACGGDGTSRSTLSELVRVYGAGKLPAFVVLRGGTVNTIARNLGLTGRPEVLLTRLLERLRAGLPLPTFEQDLLEVNGMHGFLFAAAMGARFLEAYYRGPVQGIPWAAVLAARTAVSALTGGRFARELFAPLALELELDGIAHRLESCRLLVAATVRDVGIGVKLTYGAGLEPGRFHLIASSLATAALARALPGVLRAQPMSGQPHLDTLARAAKIRFAQPETFTVDGDLFRSARIQISCGPRLRIARP
jgi:diacylglycerol kinase family enzyme